MNQPRNFMKNNKQLAIEYRLKGHSYNEISKLLGVAKSTLSSWLKSLKLSEEAQLKIQNTYKAGYTKGLLKKSKEQTSLAQKQSLEIRTKSALSIKKLSNADLKLIGVALYWGEGYKKLKTINNIQKTWHPLSLSNADPKLIKAYVKFLKVICKIPNEKIRCGVRVYKHQDSQKIITSWSKITGLPIKNFTKPYVGISKSSLSKKDFNTLPLGTIRIDVYDTKLFYTVMGWLDGINKQF